MNVYLLFPNAFPIAGASTNRVLHIAKGLQENGAEVKIICTRGTENKTHIVNNSIQGVYQGISFEYASGSVIWPSSSWGKAMEVLKGLLGTIKKIIALKKKPEIIICYANYSILQNFLFFFICKIRKITFVYAIDEYPWVLIYRHKYNILYRKIYLLFFYRLFDALIVMTTNLLVFYAKLKRKKAIMHLMPMTVEVERFAKTKNADLVKKPYIAYCGYDVKDVDGTIISKDGVDILINAYASICEKYQNMELYIIGESNKDRHLQAENLGIKERVFFTGNLLRDEIPNYLCNAVLLCLARPDNLQAQGGFPTKLGEYLATGNPVVVTSVGEIPSYLKDGWNAFLAKPGNTDSFAERMDYALSHPDLAKQVGIRGRELAENEFDYKRQGLRLLEFLCTNIIQT